MFKKIVNNYAANNNGVEIRGIDRDTFSYHEGDKMIIISRESAVGDKGSPAHIVYFFTNMHWQPPFESLPIIAADVDRISANVIEGFKALGLQTFIERKGI